MQRLPSTILFIIYFFCCNFSLQSQNIERFNTFSYSVNEGLLQTTIADIAIDQNNFCWISFPNGIQKFDGKNFTVVPVQPGLPDDKAVNFFRTNNGDLLISHSDGITKYLVDKNKFAHINRKLLPVKYPDLFMGEDNNIVYFFGENAEITGISNKDYKVVSQTKADLPNFIPGAGNYTKISSNIINHKIVFEINSFLYLYDLQKMKLVFRSDSIPFMSHYFLYQKKENEVLFYTTNINTGIHLYNFVTGKTSFLPLNEKDDESISRCIIYPWQHKTLISLRNKLYETDSTLQVLKSELVNFQNQPVAGVLTICGIEEDHFGNLYLQTVTGGIKKIIRNNYPVKYFGSGRTENNNILSILPDKINNRILAGTIGNGLLIFDTLQHLIKHIKILPGKTKSFSPNNIIKDAKGNYILFNTGEKKVWLLSKDLSQITPINITSTLPEDKRGIGYFGNFLYKNDKKIIVQSQNRIYTVDLLNNKVEEHEFSAFYTMGGLCYGSFIISHSNNELIFLDASTFKEVKRIPFKNTGNVRCFATPGHSAGAPFSNVIYIGSNKGIFIIDTNGKILSHLTRESGLPDDCIYAMVFDKDGFLWGSTNKGIFKLNRDNSILLLKKEDGLQENEFNTNVATITADGEIFFGGVNGVSSFYPSTISGFDEKINLLVTQIKINNKEAFIDTAVWNIEKMDLPYYQNALSFDFIAMANNNPGQYVYQYKMDGVDEQWIQNNDMQTVRYHLAPGKYVFNIYAARFFDKNAKPMKTIGIVIHAPFWKTSWFMVVLLVLILSLTAFIINHFAKRKFSRLLAALETEHRIQLERERISRDLHDNIGAYANAVLYNTELLEKEAEEIQRQDLMKGLKFASKDIIASLRETIWALKRDNYSAEDCLLRIRNFVQPFTKYYQHIRFEIEGEVPAGKTLHYTKALGLVRIIQEAITNSIKHADASIISVISSVSGGVWQLVVTDNGKGFDQDVLQQTEQGNGLRNMEQRAGEAGFELLIRSGQNNGTSIIVKINEV